MGGLKGGTEQGLFLWLRLASLVVVSLQAANKDEQQFQGGRGNCGYSYGGSFSSFLMSQLCNDPCIQQLTVNPLHKLLQPLP